MSGAAHGGLDTRTKLGLVLFTSFGVMSPWGVPFIPAALALGAVLAASERAWRRMLTQLGLSAAAAAVWLVLPRLSEAPVAGIAALTAGFALRFIAIGSVAAHLVATSSATDLTTALHALRLPRAVLVPSAVMLRFVPAVTAEARGVADAQRLRGASLGAALRRPIHTAETVLVPLMAASLRVGDDLAASGLIRGLGADVAPTTAHPSRYSRRDLWAVGLVAGLVVLTLSAPSLASDNA